MKYAKVFRILATALLPALLAIPVPATPALAATPTPSISLSASQGALGQTVTVTGTGFYGATVGQTAAHGLNLMFGKYPAPLSGIATQIDYRATIYQIVSIVPLSDSGDGSFRSSFAIPTILASGSVNETVGRGNYYIYLTDYWPPFNPGDPHTDGLPILQIVPFTVVVGAITMGPDNGAVGTEVSISGTYFGNTEAVGISYDSQPVNFTGNGITNANGAFGPVTFKIPSGVSGTHPIIVSGNDSGTGAQVNFTVKPSLIIVPNTGPAGKLISVYGTGFGSLADVTPSFGGTATTPGRADGGGSFVVSVPAFARPAGNYDIAVTDTKGNSGTATFALTTTGIELSTTSGPVSTEVKIDGTNFLPGRPITITFGSTKVATGTSGATGAFSIIFNVPELATGSYTIKAGDGSNTNQADFRITANIDVSPKTSLAAPGHVGSQITVTGAGFTAGGNVIIKYDGTQVAATSAKSDRSFSATFNAPASKAGEHAVVATDGTNSGQFTFIMEKAPPPIPVPLKPEMGVTANAKTDFDWQDVGDESGVTYTLQVSTSENFSSSAIVLAKTALGKSEYAITADEKLKSMGKDTPYFWRVKAVDGAGNESAWSGTGAFYVGGLLTFTQPMMYFLIGIGAFVLLILAFWLGRRTAYY